MKSFKNWYSESELGEMAVSTSWKFGPSIANMQGRDDAGLKLMSRPGFRDSDRAKIGGTGGFEGQRYSNMQSLEDPVAKKLTKATEKYGLHWVIDYFEPDVNAKEDDPASWQAYKTKADARGLRNLQNFARDYQPHMSHQPMVPPNPQNTIVYIKPTSRVHTLTSHEQIHNIGHAIWLRNPELMSQAKQELQKAVQVLQQAAYEVAPEHPPTEAEITVVLARLLDLLSYQRSLVLNPGDLSSGPKRAMTSFQNFDEVIFELFPAFINSGGQLNLRPRGVGSIARFDRRDAIPPNQEVIDQMKVRAWVWNKLAADDEAWAAVSQIMTGIIVKALRASTWAMKNGPIVPYQKLTTKP